MWMAALSVAATPFVFLFNLDTAGRYEVVVRYHGQYGEKTQQVSVNGNARNVSFPASNAWQTQSAGEFDFASGNNTVALNSSWGWMHVDSITIKGANTSSDDDTPTPVDPPSDPPPTSGDELISNGDFANGTSGWVRSTHSSASASMSVTNKEELEMDIANGSDSVWKIQLQQRNLPIEAGEDYVLSFFAAASVPRTMDITLEEDGGDWTRYGVDEINVPIDGGMEAFNFSFHGNRFR